jgi:hypothetical protein
LFPRHLQPRFAHLRPSLQKSEEFFRPLLLFYLVQREGLHFSHPLQPAQRYLKFQWMSCNRKRLPSSSLQQADQRNLAQNTISRLFLQHQAAPTPPRPQERGRRLRPRLPRQRRARTKRKRVTSRTSSRRPDSKDRARMRVGRARARCCSDNNTIDRASWTAPGRSLLSDTPRPRQRNPHRPCQHTRSRSASSRDPPPPPSPHTSGRPLPSAGPGAGPARAVRRPCRTRRAQ